MDQRLSIITLGVDDLARARAFYEDTFGWTPVAQNKDIVFFRLNGLLLSLFGRGPLLDGLPAAPAQKHPPITLAYLVGSETETDAVFAAFEKKGVTILKRPEKTPFGAYLGLVADSEGFVWDVGTNPYVSLDSSGNVTDHKDISSL